MALSTTPLQGKGKLISSSQLHQIIVAKVTVAFSGFSIHLSENTYYAPTHDELWKVIKQSKASSMTRHNDCDCDNFATAFYSDATDQSCIDDDIETAPKRYSFAAGLLWSREHALNFAITSDGNSFDDVRFLDFSLQPSGNWESSDYSGAVVLALV